MLARVMYGYERGSTVYSGRPTVWTGRIGLMYPSDYGYAVGGVSRETCLKTNLSSYSNYECHANNWLYKSGNKQWTLEHFSGNATHGFYVNGGYGEVNSFAVYDAYAVLPVLYLKSEVEIIGGDGTSTNPYTLG